MLALPPLPHIPLWLLPPVLETLIPKHARPEHTHKQIMIQSCFPSSACLTAHCPALPLIHAAGHQSGRHMLKFSAVFAQVCGVSSSQCVSKCRSRRGGFGFFFVCVCVLGERCVPPRAERAFINKINVFFFKCTQNKYNSRKILMP